MRDLERAKKFVSQGSMAFGYEASKIVIRELEAGRKLAVEIANYLEHGPDGCDPSFLNEALAEHEAAVNDEPVDRG